VRRTALTAVALLGVAAVCGAGVLDPGATLDKTTADDARDLLPPEILKHYRNGDYRNAVVDFPNSRWKWDDGFDAATRWNAEHLVLDEHKSPVDKTTGKRPDYITGLPFPDIRDDDPDAGAKILWNVDYAYYTGGNSRNLVLLSWVSRSGQDRSAVQDVRFLYYDGQPRKYAPASNPENFLFQFLALRRVRAVSPANRSDGFLGSDTSQDDGFFFDGKPEDFTWKVVGHRDGLRIVDPDSIAGKVVRHPLPGGGWRTISTNNDRAAGFQVKGWPGVAWAPVAAGVARRRFWILEGVPKDKYYLYGRLELWVDDYTWQGAWNRKFSWQGELLNTYQVTGFATAPFNEHESWWGATFAMEVSENVKGDRATVAGLNGPGAEPPNDRRPPLNRFGK